MNVKNLPIEPQLIKQQLIILAQQLGFEGVSIGQPNLDIASERLKTWLEKGYQGEMQYLERHLPLRASPAQLHPGTIRVISLYHPYLTAPLQDIQGELNNATQGYISYYARGRDYHKTLRHKLQTLAQTLTKWCGPFNYRVFTDSAPVMEVEIAQQAGLGWRGKNTLLLNREAGSWFFLGEIFTDLPLEIDQKTTEHCGRCDACIEICPTRAIVAPYVLDARRCISYLTIEHSGSIPEGLRAYFGNRIYGCDDCQIICPWNRFAKLTDEKHFASRFNGNHDLADFILFDEQEFEQRFEGSAIRRIGIIRWLRNVAVALGNGIGREKEITALKKQLHHPSTIVREHVNWALKRLSE
ncbi:MAG: tRNA epoxyqueuosine(34) reductase QueG [Ferrovum sp. 37-45-19]|nr:MAG: tRNA epoxyqueuosine(34) reductase QueG [Ferrovum sp. 21-44-67]OYV94496.1 MAG: tRNA epoxyqueuosine(34) reductase QueG [Ferrovum sp. 37-45-19]HQT81605.1 tRNA epoxyqueuosine(34) reductase QueG [Ferrovaceae bacterium]HQU06494.1 tRNA epoxyqueuosine(34) reductase QueG [Ferrovaceae bacterium]